MKVAILCGSVYGTAEEVARNAKQLLTDAGFEVLLNLRATLADVQAFAPDAFLAVTSTTGMGELPDSLMPLYSQIRDQLPAPWRGLPGAVIALGDSSYGDTYCGGVLVATALGLVRWHPVAKPVFLAWPKPMALDNHWVLVSEA